MHRPHFVICVLLNTLFGFTSLHGEDVASTATSPDGAKDSRLAEMHRKISNLKLSGRHSDAIDFAEKPLLRYSDPTRAIADATVWQLGAEGRPQGIVVMEFYRNDERGDTFWSYEFTVTSSKVVESISGPGFEFLPRGNEFSWTPIDAGRPGRTKIHRSSQMKQIARAFRVTERFGNQTWNLRVMPRPLLKYTDEKNDVLDGGIFIVAHGTNAELLLLLEARQDTSGQQTWQAGFARLGAAPLNAKYKGKTLYNVNWRPHNSRSYITAREDIRSDLVVAP